MKIKINGLCMILLDEIAKHKEGIHGYDLAKFLPSRSHQQIYRELDKMNIAGILDFTLFENGRRQDRKIYKISEQCHIGNVFLNAVDNISPDTYHRSYELEGILRALKYINPTIIINWFTDYIDNQKEAIKAASEAGLLLDAGIKQGYLKQAEFALNRAQLIAGELDE